MKKIAMFTIAASLAFFCALGCNNPFSSNSKKNNEDVNYNPVIDPANFVPTINNLYFPLAPGTTYSYQSKTEDGTERNEVNVTHQTKVILGVTCVVVDDKVWLNDVLNEATLDWYAQDKDGNVWYFGEDSKQYDSKGKLIGTEGSWEAGVDGAKPGIVMKSNPVVGDSFRQEYKKEVAEDMSQILGLNITATVPYGTFDNCVKTKDWSPLESDVVEEKYFAPGIGFVLTVTVKGGSERSELVDIKTE